MDKFGVIRLREIQTGFTAVWISGSGTRDEFGDWVFDEIREAGMYCFPRGFTPIIRIEPLELTQEQIDEMEIEELIYHTDPV